MLLLHLKKIKIIKMLKGITLKIISIKSQSLMEINLLFRRLNLVAEFSFYSIKDYTKIEKLENKSIMVRFSVA